MIEGVVAVLVMYRVVRRWAGVVPGLLAAAIFALTPIAASMFGHSMEDGALTMCLVLAADAYQRAVMEAPAAVAAVGRGLGRPRLPGQDAGSVDGPARAGHRLPGGGARPGCAAGSGISARPGVVMLAVSLSWIALYTFTPASDRPYVDGSTDNSAVAMVFGYNGLERFGISVPARSRPARRHVGARGPVAGAAAPGSALGAVPAAGPAPDGAAR